MVPGVSGTVLLPAPGGQCDVCPFFTGDPERGVPPGPEPVCSGTNTESWYEQCSRVHSGAPDPRACAACSIRCGSRVDIHAWWADVGGTALFDDVPGPAPLPEGLPRLIPMVDGDTMAEFHSAISWPAWALGLRRVFSPATHRVFPRWQEVTARQFLGLKPGQLSVLAMYAEDPLVEAWWTRRHSDGLLEAFAAQEWDVILAPNYSLYGNQPRSEMLLNFRRCHLAARELQEACGSRTTVVPNLYWFRLEDLDRHIAWVEDNEASAVAMNLQTFRWDDWWDEMVLPGVAYMGMRLDELGVDTRVIVNGVSRMRRIEHLLDAFGARLVVCTQNPLQLSRRGSRMTATGREDMGIRPGDAFEQNVRFYDDVVHRRVEAVRSDDQVEADGD